MTANGNSPFVGYGGQWLENVYVVQPSPSPAGEDKLVTFVEGDEGKPATERR